MSNQSFYQPDKAGVIVFPPLLFACTLAVGIALGYIFPTLFLATKIAMLIGAFLLIVSFALLRNAVKALTKHKTTVNPNGATTIIVKEGIYKHTRNPMYIAFTLIYISVLIMTNSWYGLLLLIPLLIVVQKGIIEREEKYLIQKFGEEYLSYKKKVNRWF